MHWTIKAKREIAIAPRTWFGTLTFRPEIHAWLLTRARVRLDRQGVNFDALPYGEQFAERVREITPECTKYLKRVRKASSHPFRYLLVYEHHESGLPHMHLLVHETEIGSVKHEILSRYWNGVVWETPVHGTTWRYGFEKWKLISDPQQAGYVCKYLAKATCARVRASIGYGEEPMGLAEIIQRDPTT